MLVSFFIFMISYKYAFPSALCLTSIATLKTLYRSISPLSPNTGSANLESYEYHPYFAFLLCFSLRFSSYVSFVAILSNSGNPCAALAFAFAFAPFKIRPYVFMK